MTSIDFLNKVHKSLDSQEYRLSFSPAKSKNYMPVSYTHLDVYKRQPGLVAARDPESGEEFVIFDGGRHGYDNMFCDEHDPSELEHRPLKRYEIPASKLVLELGYSIDYEDEKENFEPDEADTVELINGERMPWEQAKRDGIDYIALYYVNEKGKPVQILDAELA